MIVKQFINHKAPQLAFYLQGFWDGKVPYRELDLFFWDTMEEWLHCDFKPDYPYSQKERVFWHVLHQMHFWPERILLHDSYLHDELSVCLDYLEDDAYYCPLDCIGIRP